MKKYLPGLCILLLGACMATGPQKALNGIADALAKNNSAAFLSHIDMQAFAANHIRNVTRNDEALNSINALGQLFGLGNLDDLIGNLVDMQKKLADQFNRGVASGELVAECAQSTTADCPWVPASLREAAITELGPDAAIAKITTPAKITSWLALHKIGDSWQIVGQAVLEATARQYATAGPKASRF